MTAYFKITHINRVRGAVVCNNCPRPRCIYSESDVSRMRPPPPPLDPETAPDNTHAITEAEVKRYRALAKDRLLDAIESAIFLCGMAPLDPDEPCHNIFKSRP